MTVVNTNINVEQAYGDDDTLMDPYYNQEDIERRRLLRKRVRSTEREEAEAAESASKKRDINSRL